jgi:integral membrane protein (TIGR00529 family)
MADLLKLLFILAITIYLLFKKWDLGLVLLCDTVIVTILYSYPFMDMFVSMGKAVVARDTLSLIGAVFLVLILAELMRRTEAMNGMVVSLQALIPDTRITLGLIPLIVGLLPMLGGAMFSAPMVNELGTRLKLSAERKTFINFWFRHSMEYTFPLYNSLLMMAALIGVSVYDFIRVSWPMTVVALISGSLWGLIGVKRESIGDKSSRSSQPSIRHWRLLFLSTWPLLLVIVTVVVLKVNMILSLMGVITMYVLAKRVVPSEWLDVVRKGIPLKTFTSIMGVMIFKQVLEDASAVEQIPAALGSLGLPPLLVTYVVPMLVGLLTGTAPAALALSIPLVAPLLGSQAVGLDMSSAVWLYTASFSGILLSPLHLCLALTREYFGASWGRLYRLLIPGVVTVVLFALGFTLLF